MSVKDWIRFSLLSLIWGTSFLWIKIAVSQASPFVLVGFRSLFGALSLVVILAFGKRLKIKWADIRPWIGVFCVIGFFNVALPHALISWSEQTMNSGIASILNSTTPLFTMLLAPIMLKDDPWTLPKVLGLVLGFGGVVVLMLPELSHGLDQNILGYATMLLATLSYAFASVYNRRNAVGLDSQMQTFLQLTLATIMMWAFTLVVERPINVTFSSLTWIAMLWLGVLGSGFAYILYFSLIHSIGPTRATMVTYVLPLVAVFLGAVFLKEQIYWEVILGGAMIILGIVVVNMKLFQPKKVIPQESA